MLKSKQKIKFLFYHFILVLVLIPYQNCSESGFKTNDNPSLASATDSNEIPSNTDTPSNSDSAAATPLSANIVIDEPLWYTGTTNMCKPTAQCYFPDLGLSLTSGYAPFAVLFQGGTSTPANEIADWNWDFGDGTKNDPHGQYATGMNAAHVFETPGDYTIKLTVQNSRGQKSSKTITVHVKAPDGSTYYLDSAIGDDNCDGKSAIAESTTRCPWKTADKAFSKMVRLKQWDPIDKWPYKPGDKILFKRGQIFSMSTAGLSVGHGYATQGYSFGAYGELNAEKPIIQYTGTSTTLEPMLKSGMGLGYISFVDLKFNFLNGNYQSLGLIYASEGVKNLLFLRSEFIEPNNGAVGISGSTEEKIVANIFLVDCFASQPTTNNKSTTLIFDFGTQGYVLIGNNFDYSGNHISYNSRINNVVVTKNIFNRPPFGRTALRITEGKNIYIADNQFLGWIDPIDDMTPGPHGVPVHNGGGKRYNYALVELAPNGPQHAFNIQQVIFERNVITNFEGGLNLTNIGEATVRNNVFVSPSPMISHFINLSKRSGVDLSRPLTNIKIIGNTFVANGAQSTTWSFINVSPWLLGATPYGDNHSNLQIQNNIFEALPESKMLAYKILGLENNLLEQMKIDTNIYHSPGAINGKLFSIQAPNTSPINYSLPEWRSFSKMDFSSLGTAPAFVKSPALTSFLPGFPSAQQNELDAAAYRLDLQLSPSSANPTSSP